jgi:hypothetical protein
MNTTGGPGLKVRSLQQMPQQIEPARDLWPQIQAQLQPRRRSWAVPATLAASALLATIAFVTGYRIHEAGRAPTAEADSGALIRAALVPDPAYQSSREALLRELPAKLAQLPADSQQHVRDSLQAIQQALRDIEAELGRDARNVLLQELLIRTQQEEMRVLATVEEIDELDQEI